MKSNLRPSVRGDLPGIAAMLARAFKTTAEAPFLNLALMEWKYFEPRGDWLEPRSYVLEKNGSIAAHAGIWPVVFGSGEDAIRGIEMIDWAADPEAPGAGMTLVNRLAGMFDFIYSIGGSEATRKVLPAFGFVECARVWKGARPLRPVRQMLTHQTRNWKLAPRLMRNTLWAASGGRKTAGWRAEKTTPGKLSGGLASGGGWFSPRSPAFFEYLLRCPATKFELHSIRHDGAEEGCFVLGIVRGQARIGGIWLRDPQPETLRAAYSLARQTAAGIGEAVELAAGGTSGISETAAVESGLRMFGTAPVLLLNRTGRLRLPPEFQFQMCDDDEAFLDSGSTCYWT